MDVVRANIEKIKGRIDLDSVPGKGTTITITIPLTVAIMTAMMVAVGDEIGLHPHFWRRDAEDRGWVTDFADRAWVERVITDSVTLFRDSLGFAPTSFRAGDGLIDGVEPKAGEVGF